MSRGAPAKRGSPRTQAEQEAFEAAAKESFFRRAKRGPDGTPLEAIEARKRGRPLAREPRARMVALRLSEREFGALTHASATIGHTSLSEYVREMLIRPLVLAAAKR